jgi:hypothetical protein
MSGCHVNYLKMSVFWDVAPCSLVEVDRLTNLQGFKNQDISNVIVTAVRI